MHRLGEQHRRSCIHNSNSALRYSDKSLVLLEWEFVSWHNCLMSSANQVKLEAREESAKWSLAEDVAGSTRDVHRATSFAHIHLLNAVKTFLSFLLTRKHINATVSFLHFEYRRRRLRRGQTFKRALILMRPYQLKIKLYKQQIISKRQANISDSPLARVFVSPL